MFFIVFYRGTHACQCFWFTAIEHALNFSISVHTFMYTCVSLYRFYLLLDQRHTLLVFSTHRYCSCFDLLASRQLFLTKWPPNSLTTIIDPRGNKIGRTIEAFMGLRRIRTSPRFTAPCCLCVPPADSNSRKCFTLPSSIRYWDIDFELNIAEYHQLYLYRDENQHPHSKIVFNQLTFKAPAYGMILITSRN